MKIICHPEALAEGSQEKIPQQVRDDKSHFPRPTGEGLRERGLSAHDEIPKQVRNDKYLSEAHRKELNVLTSYRLNNFKKKIAFTLAEVLITLGIIGVVAAMTIPTLIADYQEKVMVTKVKQAHSQLMNAIRLYIAQNNCVNMLCLFDTKKTTEKVAAELATVLKGAKICETGASDKQCAIYTIKSNSPILRDGVYVAGDALPAQGKIYLQNGVLFALHQNTECIRHYEAIIRDENGYDTGERVPATSDSCARIYFDVNNIQGPNIFGVDVFRYDILSDGKTLPFDEKLLNNVLLYNKIEYTPYNIGESIE